MPLTIIYRIATAVGLGCNIDNLYGILLPLLICLTYLLYYFTTLPYVSTFHNYRAGIIHIT